jgi:hypothetical protein
MKIEFSTEGAAFKSEYEDAWSNNYTKREECSRILRRIASHIELGDSRGPIMDINGNTIGEWSL